MLGQTQSRLQSSSVTGMDDTNATLLQNVAMHSTGEWLLRAYPKIRFLFVNVVDYLRKFGVNGKKLQFFHLTRMLILILG